MLYVVSLYANLPVQDFLLAFVFGLIGSIFPDIDTRSVAQKLFFVSLFLGVLFCLIYYQNSVFLFAAGAIALVPLLSRHRGIFHRWWFLLGLSVLGTLGGVAFFPEHMQVVVLCSSSFFFGCVTHLLLDK